MKLSIVIPVFNEEKTVERVLDKILDLKVSGFEKEVIVVDDASIDKTNEIINKVKNRNKGSNVKLFRHEENLGKGAAVRTGIENAKGDYILIQDADLEYNPDDIPKLTSRIDGNRNVIYGTRLARLPHLDREERNAQFLAHYIGNRFLSLITSTLYGQWITDMETCYKLFPRSALNGTVLRARGFDFEPEITAKLLKKGYRIIEVPIRTNPRGYDEGKKLNTFRDGTIALWSLVKYRFVD
jgi:glycosyltransferase involved in cell wall biosynthesis